MGKYVVGSDFETFKAKARAAIMTYFTNIALMDGRNPTQRVMDSVKLAEAYRLKEGFPSKLLSDEAADRGIPDPRMLADLVIAEGSKAGLIERNRVQASIAVDKATTHLEVIAVLTERDIPYAAEIWT